MFGLHFAEMEFNMETQKLKVFLESNGKDHLIMQVGVSVFEDRHAALKEYDGTAYYLKSQSHQLSMMRALMGAVRGFLSKQLEEAKRVLGQEEKTFRTFKVYAYFIVGKDPRETDSLDYVEFELEVSKKILKPEKATDMMVIEGAAKRKAQVILERDVEGPFIIVGVYFLRDC